MLASHPDPLGVFSSTAPVVARAQHVLIDLRRIDTVAHLLSLRELPIPAYAPIWNVEENRVEFLGPETYPDVKDPAVDLVYFAAQDWAAATAWQPGPSDA